MMIVGMWFTRKEQPARAGIFYCFNSVGSMTGGILFYGVGQAKGFPVWSKLNSHVIPTRIMLTIRRGDLPSVWRYHSHLGNCAVVLLAQ